ncbi:peptidoglycan hydrolase-like protein with peptidoglycan-binding domain [Leifsonia sp. AK011]|uniref:peptidoglycan-binding protein n=1 Tax=Leifsonia sp. AK011 TaxID=2723075 RepID=UPI0015C7BA28|nr:peptidoglycan-binding protein [Leifsonia sp. AK011]NYF09538.1 peptidoglycan hydrolase-like protein with peptidoglycan-binding domain [Leifsonia sp. AK011]
MSADIKESTETAHRRPPSRRRRAVIAVSVVAILATGAVVAAAVFLREGPADAPPPAGAVSTEPVTSGDMVAETKVVGAIAYARSEAIASGVAGVVTELPSAGTVIDPGGVLYRVNTLPVLLLSGTTPAWRDFSSDMSDGPDVLQFEQNLAALGFLEEEPDATFDWDTTVAVRAWQVSLGLEPTGSVERAMLLFWNGSLRVDAPAARLGQDVGPGSELYTATSVEKVVDLAVSSSDRSLAVAGSGVTITLPDGSTVDGAIQDVGSPQSRPKADGSGSSVVIPVRITVADQDAVADLALASVTVSFASTLRSDVLTVPVDALVPLDDTHFAVEIPPSGDSADRELVPVSVGAVASGRAEISGDRIVAGLLVVVPAR